MADVAPELLEKMQKSFQRSMESNTKAASLRKKIESGKAKYSDAGKYADEVGDALTKAFRSTLSSSTLPDGKMYWNIAERTIQPMYEESYRLTSEAVKEVQQGLNATAGIGLKAQTANLDTDIIRRIMNYVCDADQYDDAADTLYKSAQAWNRTIVDQTLKKNAEFQAKSGRSPRIIRTAEANCCSWCADLEGVYEYKGSYSVPEDVYRRHENCKCSVEYDPGTRNRTQNVWSKQWHDDQDRDKIEERKKIGIDTTSGVIQKRINQGQYNLKLSSQQYLKHVEGTNQYEQYAASRAANGKNPQSKLTISQNETQRLIDQYSGKGTPYIDSEGNVSDKEFVSADHVVGKYCTKSGEWKDTKRFAIYYGKKSSHIVPVKENHYD